MIEPLQLGTVVVNPNRQGTHCTLKLKHLLLERSHILILDLLHPGHKVFVSLFQGGDVGENSDLERAIIGGEGSVALFELSQILCRHIGLHTQLVTEGGELGETGLKGNDAHLELLLYIGHLVDIRPQADDPPFGCFKLEGNGIEDVTQIFDIFIEANDASHITFHFTDQLAHEQLQALKDGFHRREFLLK